MFLKKFPLEKTSIPCSRAASFVSSQAPFPALRRGSNYPSLGTRCGSKLNQTIYLSGAAWLRHIMWFSEKLLPSESMSLQLSVLIKKRRDTGACVRLAFLFVGLFFFPLEGNGHTQEGSSFLYWCYFPLSIHSLLFKNTTFYSGNMQISRYSKTSCSRNLVSLRSLKTDSVQVKTQVCSREKSCAFTCFFSRLQGRREFSIRFETEISQRSAFIS